MTNVFKKHGVLSQRFKRRNKWRLKNPETPTNKKIKPTEKNIYLVFRTIYLNCSFIVILFIPNLEKVRISFYIFVFLVGDFPSAVTVLESKSSSISVKENINDTVTSFWNVVLKWCHLVHFWSRTITFTVNTNKTLLQKRKSNWVTFHCPLSTVPALQRLLSETPLVSPRGEEPPGDLSASSPSPVLLLRRYQFSLLPQNRPRL